MVVAIFPKKGKAIKNGVTDADTGCARSRSPTKSMPSVYNLQSWSEITPVKNGRFYSNSVDITF